MRTLLLTLVTCLWVASTATAKYSGGSGTAQDPYRIATAADLIALGETPADYDKHFILTANIDLDPNLPGRKVFDKAIIAPDTDPGYDFQGTSFTGLFDGKGHTIKNLKVTGRHYLGLLGCLGYTASISNLGLEAVEVRGTGWDVGGLVGANGGLITSSHSSGLVSGDSSVGGLVGYNVPGVWGPRGSIVTSFWDVQTSGWTTSAGGTGKTTAEMQTTKTFLDAGWDFVGETKNGTADLWWILEGKDYPHLWWEAQN